MMYASITRYPILRLGPFARLQNNYTIPSIIRTAASYSSKSKNGDAEITSSWEGINPDVLPYIRRNDSSKNTFMHEESLEDSGMHMYFLGTGNGISDRLSSCTVLRVGKEGCLFDAGEGAQRHIKRSHYKMKKINRIFITHMHADHVLGLPGLLLSSNQSNFFEEDNILYIYGPQGIYNFIATNLALTHSKVKMNIEVHELVGGTVGVHWNRKGMLGNFPQFQYNNILRKTIPCGEDGTWTIKEFDEITKDYPPGKSNIKISAAQLHHVPNVPTFGYVVEEQKPPLKLDLKRAMELDLLPSPKYNQLKNGFPVMNDLGTREVHPDEVLFDHGFKSRKVAILGDLCGIPTPMARLCRDADVVVHEATLQESDQWRSVRRGHATASMAGRFADATNADLLVLNHHPATVDGGDLQGPAREAEKVIMRLNTRVLSACDFMEVAVPRKGFQFGNEEGCSTAEDPNAVKCALDVDEYENGILPKDENETIIQKLSREEHA